MRNLRPSVVAVVVVVGALAAGCGSSDGDSGTTGQGASTAVATAGAASKPAKIAYVAYSYTDFQQAQERGMKEAVEPSGGSLTVFNSNFDPQKQTEQCLAAVASGRYNVVVLAPVSPPTGVPCVRAAKAADIPVVTVEAPVGADVNAIEPQADGVVGSVVAGPDAGAKLLADTVAQACEDKDPCNVIADTIPGDPFGDADLRFIAAVPGVKVVQKINSAYDASLMQKLIPDALTAHPEADVLVTMADNTALAAVPAVKAAGMSDSLRVVGFSGSRQGAKAVADGVLFGTTGSWPQQWGKAAGEMAVKAVNGQPIDPPGIDAVLIDEPQMVTPDTVSQFKPEWGAAAS